MGASWENFLNRRLEADSKPVLGANGEVVVFAMGIGNHDRWAKWTRVEYPERDQRSPWYVGDGLLVATSWRLLISHRRSGEWEWWPCETFTDVAIAKDKLSLQLTTGQIIKIKLKLPRPGLWDQGAWLFGTPSVKMASMTLSQLRTNAANDLDSVFYGFFAEMVKTASERRR
jgi:hypothetical protein